MGTTGGAQSAAPQDTRQAAPSRGKWPHLSADLGRLAGGSAVDGPLGLLAVEEERLAAAAHGKHEEETRQPDPDWPDWYAQYTVNESAGQDVEA
jgi:hypothetical protein